jgi:hypothetical protein
MAACCELGQLALRGAGGARWPVWECGDKSPLSHWETCLPLPKRGRVRARLSKETGQKSPALLGLSQMAHFLVVLPMVFPGEHVPTGDLHVPTVGAQRPNARRAGTFPRRALANARFTSPNGHLHGLFLNAQRPTVGARPLFRVLPRPTSVARRPTGVCNDFSAARDAQRTARGNFSVFYIAQPSAHEGQRPVGDPFSAARSFQRLARDGFSGGGRLLRAVRGSLRVSRRCFSWRGNLPTPPGTSDWSQGVSLMVM